MTGDREICMAAEMDGYVSKPIIADDLNNEIERLRVERLNRQSVSTPLTSSTPGS